MPRYLSARSRSTSSSSPEETNANSEPSVIVDCTGQIMSIGLNREGCRNAVDDLTSRLLFNAFHTFESDDSLRVAVLHGIGPNFSSGLDLAEIASDTFDGQTSWSKRCENGRTPMGPTNLMIKSTKPIISAVNGWCVAGGLELALASHIRLIEISSRLGFLGRRLGFPLTEGTAGRLSAMIGMSRAADLILTGRIFDANECHALGLCNAPCQDGTAYGLAMDLARGFVKFPQNALQLDVESLKDSCESIPEQFDQEWREGAVRFVRNGTGRHGKFNVFHTQPQGWQLELAELKEKYNVVAT